MWSPMKTFTVTLTDEEFAILDIALVKLSRKQRDKAFRHDAEASAAQARECRRRAILADRLARKLGCCSFRRWGGLG